MSSTIKVDLTKAVKSLAADDVISCLNQCLANAYALGALAQNAHWNVEGCTFLELHEHFGEIYSGAFEAADDLAERLRQLQVYVAVDLAMFQQKAGFTQPSAPVDKNVWISALLTATEKVIADLKNLEKLSDNLQMIEVQDLALAQAQVHMKTAWMLRSLLKE